MEAQADIEAKDEDGVAPLQDAAWSGDSRSLAVLLAAGYLSLPLVPHSHCTPSFFLPLSHLK